MNTNLVRPINEQRYLTKVTPQHRRPRFLGWLSGNLKPLLDAKQTAATMYQYFNLEQSEGVQLDTTGDIVGRGRVLSFDPSCGSSPILEDELYRLLQKAKISLNQWDGTIPSVLELWETLFPQYSFILHDKQDMTMDMYIIGPVTRLEQELLSKNYIAPKPMGVWRRFIFVYEHEGLESLLHVGTAVHGSDSLRELPPVEFEHVFNNNVYTATAVHGSKSTRSLTPVEFEHVLNNNVYTATAFINMTQTKIKEVTFLG